MQVKYLSWILVFILSISLASALVVNTPITNQNVSRYVEVNWTKEVANGTYYSNPSELYGNYFTETSSVYFAASNNLTLTGINFTAKDTSNTALLIYVNGVLNQTTSTISFVTNNPIEVNFTPINITQGSNVEIRSNSGVIFPRSNGGYVGGYITSYSNDLAKVSGYGCFKYYATAFTNNYELLIVNGSNNSIRSYNYSINLTQTEGVQPNSYKYNLSLVPLNLSIGNYRIVVNASSNANNNIATNTSGTFNLTTNALLNISVFSQATSSPISFTSNLSSNVQSAYAWVLYDVINGNAYNLSVNSTNYNTNTSSYTINSFGTTYLTRYLTPYNSINLTIKDESTGNIITSAPNTSLSIVSDSGLVTYTNVNGSKVLSGLTTDYYTLTFDKSGYNSRQYYISVPDGSYQFLTVYLNNGTDILFNFKTNTGGSLPDVVFQVYTVVNGSSVLVESVKSDITGKAQVSLESNKPYTFIATKSGFNNYSFTLNPVLFTSYDVVLTPSTAGSLVVPSAYVTFSPTKFYRFQNVNFEIEFISQYDSLTSYAYTITTPSQNFSDSGNNDHGERFTESFKLDNVSNGDVLYINYYYNLSNGVEFNRTISYPIVYVYSNRTWTTMGNSINQSTSQDSITGYYVGERVIIVTFIAIVMFGVGWLIGGGITGFIFAIIPILFFINSGFVPKQLYYVTFIFLIFYVIGRGTDS